MISKSELHKWDARFIDLAHTIAQWSKGPRKRVGAVLVRPDKSIASMGYNGPPRGFDDKAFLAMPRKEQHRHVIHAEANVFMQLSDEEYNEKKFGYTLYITPMFPCEECAKLVIWHKVGRVVAHYGNNISADWLRSADKACDMFDKANVQYIICKD